MQGKGAAPKVLPWLWPLAEEGGAAACFGLEEKLRLLRALRGCPLAGDAELGEKVRWRWAVLWVAGLGLLARQSTAGLPCP